MIEVTAVISTRDRYFTTLPNCLISIALQTYRPKHIIIYDDGEQKDLRQEPLYENIFKFIQARGISWTIQFGDRKGQVANHQRSIREANTEWIWRIDDDNVIEHDVLERLVSNVAPGVGAVAGLVLDPKQPIVSNRLASNKIEDIYCGLNEQWFKFDGIKEVDHLYSTFIYSKEAARNGYCMELSKIGHREETIFTYEMKRAGWKLLIDSSAVTWHLRLSSGGIRSETDGQLWANDEIIFSKKLQEWGVVPRHVKLIVLDSGLGDHLVFKSILPEIRKRYKDLILAHCYPEVFKEDTDIKQISIAEAYMVTKSDDHSVYKWMWDRNWKKSLADAYRGMYL